MWGIAIELGAEVDQQLMSRMAFRSRLNTREVIRAGQQMRWSEIAPCGVLIDDKEPIRQKPTMEYEVVFIGFNTGESRDPTLFDHSMEPLIEIVQAIVAPFELAQKAAHCKTPTTMPASWPIPTQRTATL